MFFQFSFLFYAANFINNHLIDNNYVFNKPALINAKFIEKYNLTEIPSNSYLDLRYGINNSMIQTHNFYNNNFRKVRLTYFKGNDQELFSSIWYPSYDYDCPILNIDLVKFNQNASLCFVNLVEIYNRKEYYDYYIDPFIKIKNDYPELSENTSKHLLPFKNFLSKAMLYGHIYNSSLINGSVSDALDRYLGAYSKMFIRRPVIRYHTEKVHKDYNEVRKNIDKHFLMKDYFDAKWYNLLIDNYYS